MRDQAVGRNGAATSVRLTGVIIRRLLALPVVMAGVAVVTFFISRIAPGDPAQLIAGPRASPEAIAAIRADLKLDQPLFEQFMDYLTRLLSGDLGVSIMSDRPVLDEVLGYLPATFELMSAAFLLTLALGIPVGIVSAVSRGKLADVVGRGIALIGISTPTFWLGLLGLLVFYAAFDIAPGSGRLDPSVAPPALVTGLYTVDAALAGDWAAFSSALRHLALPSFVLAFASLGVVVRLVRGALIEVLGQDFVRTARAYGLPEHKVLLSYALPHALTPFVTVMGLELSSLLFGSVVIESVFGWPGLGSYVLAAILNLDFPVIMGFAVIASIVFVIANLLVDVVYLLIDPRIRGVA